MAISQAVCSSFKAELATGVHDFTASTGDVFKLALFSSSASLDASTTVYTTSGEVTGTGYTAGGNTLTNVTPVMSGTTCIIDFADTSWTSSSLTARGALLYNSTKGNKAVAVFDFGSDRISTASTFAVAFPTADASSAVLRIS